MGELEAPKGKAVKQQVWSSISEFVGSDGLKNCFYLKGLAYYEKYFFNVSEESKWMKTNLMCSIYNGAEII